MPCGCRSHDRVNSTGSHFLRRAAGDRVCKRILLDAKGVIISVTTRFQNGLEFSPSKFLESTLVGRWRRNKGLTRGPESIEDTRGTSSRSRGKRGFAHRSCYVIARLVAASSKGCKFASAQTEKEEHQSKQQGRPRETSNHSSDYLWTGNSLRGRAVSGEFWGIGGRSWVRSVCRVVPMSTTSGIGIIGGRCG